jgi:thioredoxin reductase (NADPH)
VVEQPNFDLAIAGGGASGLAAAIQGASDGMRVVLLERAALGGRVRERKRVEIVPGLPVGLTGAEFAERAVELATRLGVDLRTRVEIVGLEVDGSARQLRMADGSAVSAISVLIATGTEDPVLPTPGMRAFLGAGVYFGMPRVLPETLRGSHVFVTGEPIAAAEGALRLSHHCRRVGLLLSERHLYGAVPEDLRGRLRPRDSVILTAPVEIIEAAGVERLEVLILRDGRSGRTLVRNAAALFVLGMDRPRTAWLERRLALDAGGYVITSPALPPPAGSDLALETSVPGVFAAGGVRGARGCCAEALGAEGIAAARQALRYVNGRAPGAVAE